jgi:hypothetical protein
MNVKCCTVQDLEVQIVATRSARMYADSSLTLRLGLSFNFKQEQVAGLEKMQTIKQQ